MHKTVQNETLPRDNDPQRALLTLEQLSQTLESMSGVVERLRHHLNQQLQEEQEEQQEERSKRVLH